MKREAIVVRCSCVSSRLDQLNKASIYKLLDVFAGGSLFDSKSFHLERGELKITTSSCFICGQNVQISCSNAQRGEFFIEQERVAYLDKALLPAIRGMLSATASVVWNFDFLPFRPPFLMG